MLKITPRFSDGAAVLKLEGTLREAWIDETRRAIDAAAVSHRRISLDLTDVSFADDAGIALLGALIQQGIHIAACSGFLAAALGLEDL
jgi:anti-anti-sigma regulatory factor